MVKAHDFLDSKRAYLFPAIYLQDLACPRCRGGKNSGYDTCPQCDRAPLESYPDNLGFGMFARLNEQTSVHMFRYKDSDDVDGRLIVEALLLRGLGEAIRTPYIGIDLITTIPSLSGRPGVHPLYTLTELAARKHGVENKVKRLLTASPGATTERRVQRGVFDVDSEKIAGKAILLIDDTWTSGGNMRSGVLALREAGAREVNCIALARWVNLGSDWGGNDIWQQAAESRLDFGRYSFFSGTLAPPFLRDS